MNHRILDPFVSPEVAQRVRELGQAFGPYEVYVTEPVNKGFGAGLVRRHDAAWNYLKTGGRFGSGDSPEDLLARVNLFRGVYALPDEIRVPEIESIFHHEEFIAGCRELTGMPIVRPSMLYANILVPGQELPLHTDTPEYRGLDKWTVPEWFMVVMQHSGLFERWRKNICAGVAFIERLRRR